MSERPGIIVPVHDEASLLPATVPPLLREARKIGADLVFVCNGCSDGSAGLLRSLTAGAARIIELPEPGKARALQAGEAAVTGFPRFFVDADVVLGPDCLVRMREVLATGGADLVAPRLRLDLSGCSRAAAGVARTWRDLPHMRREGFHNVLGISRQGRSAWGELGELHADDTFMVAHVPADRRAIATGAEATIFPPRSLGAWIGVRQRWRTGHAELRAQGLAVPRTGGQRRALLAMLLSPGTAAGAACYLLVTLLAKGRSGGPERWYRDHTTRPVAQQAE